MSFQLVLFYVFGAILVGAALAVVTVRNPVHAALFLVLAFVTAAGVWMLTYAEFLAITLVLVYVGAVMVLFLFVVMMLDINIDKLREGFWKHLPVALVVGIIMVAEMGLLLSARNFAAYPQPVIPAADASNTKAIGRVLYTDYLLPFEIASVILLVAIVAAIALTLRRRKDTKYQNPSQQVSVKRNDRLRIVSMKAESGGTTREEGK